MPSEGAARRHVTLEEEDPCVVGSPPCSWTSPARPVWSSATPETVLGIVQCFDGLIADIAIAHGGRVKDFEGDGVLLYFESAVHAAESALAIRAALDRERCEAGCGDGPGASVRMSLTLGEVAIGAVGPAANPALALVGSSVNLDHLGEREAGAGRAAPPPRSCLRDRGHRRSHGRRVRARARPPGMCAAASFDHLIRRQQQGPVIHAGPGRDGAVRAFQRGGHRSGSFRCRQSPGRKRGASSRRPRSERRAAATG